MKTGRRLAFDYGQVRIGVAVSDPSGLIATPVGNLLNEVSTLENQLLSLFKEYEPIYLVVGEPKHLSGGANPSLLAAQAFGELLKTLSNIPVYFVDERLSTVSAAKNLRRVGRDAKSSKNLIDAMAATMILEGALERERLGGYLD